MINKNLMKGLFKFAGRYKYLTIAGMIFSALSAILSIVPIIMIWLCTAEVIDTWPNFQDATSIKTYAWMALIFSVISILVYFAALMCTHFAAFRIAKNMRIEALTHLMKLPLGYFNESGSGKLRRVIDESSGHTETYLAHQLPDLVGAMVTPIAVLILLFTFNWKMGLISIAPIIISFLFLFQMIGKDHAQNIKNYQTSLENMNNEAVEYVRGIPVVKTFGQSIFSFKKFYDTIIQYRDFAVTYTLRLRRPMSFYTLFINAIPIFLVLGSIFLISTSPTPKKFFVDFLFYVFFTPICFNMMNKIMWSSEESVKAEDALNRINEMLKKEPLKETGKAKLKGNFDISIKGVSFTYPNSNNKALSNISLEIPQGTTTALVGPSGGGKSTTAMLIARFFDVDSGSISIGGVDIRDVTEKDLMSNISFVFQDNHLFKASILENIMEGKADATMEEVTYAIKAAHCEDIIAKFESGLATVVGTKGVYLSGGEVQRIALARAILKDSPIILLDEATAFADPENEYEIQLALKELTKDKTVLVIAHRLSTIKNVSNIHVVSDGKLMESGNHRELLEKNCLYKSMWDEYQKAASWKLKEVI
jgi:ATP-binding cassette subfamily B protein